ncbi:MAG: HYR domain-containing protein [Ahniella sp.]|nr:HYR domain-containing protein [Ahniella sp.]
MDITLQSPAGTVVTLSTDNGAGNDNVYNGTTWDVNANPAGAVPYATNNGVTTDHTYVNLTTATPLTAEESLSAFMGEDPNGTWTLTVSDDLAGDGGSLDAFTLNITTGVAPCLAITCPANVRSYCRWGPVPLRSRLLALTGDPGCGAITCDATSGGSFNLGGTNVTCTAAAGPTCNFSVTVADAEAPVMTCPGNIVTQPTSVQGATVLFATPTVTDNCPGVGAATCAPASGSIFPTGLTNVSCAATDAATNAGACAFSVSVGQNVSIPVLNSLGLFALIAMVLGFGWARRQSL